MINNTSIRLKPEQTWLMSAITVFAKRIKGFIKAKLNIIYRYAFYRRQIEDFL